MSEGKGKARATHTDDAKSPSESFGDSTPSTSSSILSRIGSSANSLGRSILLPPRNGNELNHLGTTTSAVSGKGIPHGHSTGSASTENPAVIPPSGSSSIVSPAGYTIRSQNQEALSSRTEAEFSEFANSTNGIPVDYSLLRSEDAEVHAAEAKIEFLSVLDNAEPLTAPEDQLKFPSENEQRERATQNGNEAATYMTVSMQEASDGKAVSDLLSDPSVHDGVNDPSITYEEDRFYWLKEEERIVKLIEQDKVPKELRGIIDKAKETPGLFNQLGTEGHQDPSHSLDRLGNASKEMDVWYRFLTSYQDDVWGDLGPLVGEAREELKTWTPEKGDILQKPTAVRRLGLILGHIRQ